MTKIEATNKMIDQIDLKVLEKTLNQNGKSLKQVSQQTVNLEELPDPVMHKRLSFYKSGLRILACVVGIFGTVPIAFILLALAEGVGIVEEMV